MKTSLKQYIWKHHNLKPQVVTESFVPRGHLKIAREFAWLPSMKPYLLCNNTINDILAIGIFFELEHDLILVRLLERNVVVSQFEILHGNTGPVKVKKTGAWRTWLWQMTRRFRYGQQPWPRLVTLWKFLEGILTINYSVKQN